MRQLKPSRILENKPSGQVGSGEAQDVLKGQASGLGIGLLSPLFPSPPRGAGSLSIAQETWSGKPTSNPGWKLQKETDVLIRQIFEIISFQRKISQFKCQALSPALQSFPMSQLSTSGGQLLELQLQHHSFQ